MKSLLVFLSIVCLFSSPALGAGKDGGRGPAAVDSDSSSTFQMGDPIAVAPLDTVTVPLHLYTSNAVTFIENRINWPGADLDLIGVSLGAGVPDTLSLATISQTSGEIRFSISVPPGGAAVSVGTDPIVYLDFEVPCDFGYGSVDTVSFYADNNFNYYISGGVPAAPLRDDGTVHTLSDYSTLTHPGSETAYVGQQDIPFPIQFSQWTPGRLTEATIHYDDSQFSVDSVTALSGLEGGSVSINSDSGGYLVVGVSTDFLPAGPRQMFTIHFASLDNEDNVLSTVQLTDATRENTCGDLSTPQMGLAYIHIPNHTASVDMSDITRYTDAAYYDVPVVMDSNHPINAFNLLAQFPADEIYFDGFVSQAGFVGPVGGVDTNDTTLVRIVNSTGADYDPSSLPATVFYMRFRPWTTPAAGTDFTVSWIASDPQSAVQYYTDLGAYHDADITSTESGTIHIIAHSGGGHPCCPALYVWNGGGYSLDNNILAECDGKVVDHDITDYYRLTQPLADDDGTLRFQIREDGNALSDFSDFELLAVDRPNGEPIQVTRGGDIVVTDRPFAIQWARDDTGRDIKALIEAPDNVLYTSKKDGWFEVGFGTLTGDQVGKFAAETHDALAKNKNCPILDAAGKEVKSQKLRVEVKTADGTWRTIADADARHNPVRQSTLITPELIGEGRELVLRYSWETYYRIDVLEFSASRPFDGDVRELPMIDASRTDDAAVRLQPANGHKLSLSPGEAIDVAFDASDLPALRDGYTREYVFVSTGKYTEPAVGETSTPQRGFALDANHPNPFNPTTTIGYNLPAAARVELKIYDVTGALVRTLVSGRQDAGEKSVVWDGLSDAGTPMASGVYFYRLQTTGFIKTRKMVLLK